MRMRTCFYHCFSFVILILLSGCLSSEEAIEVTTSNYFDIVPGDIIVASINTRSVIQLSADGQFKNTLLTLIPGRAVRNIGWNPATKEILVNTTAANSLISISPRNRSTTLFTASTNLAGTIGGVTADSNGNVYFATTTTNGIRKFSSSGAYITTGGFPIASNLATMNQLSSLSNGNLLGCSNTGSIVRTFTLAGVVVATTAASGIAGTTQAHGCVELADGKIAVAFNGTTDTISIRSADMATQVDSYSDTSLLGNPKNLARSLNGNILAVDGTNNWIVEITPSGDYVRTLAEGVFSNAHGLMVVPLF